MDTLILYNYFRSSTSYRARIALNFKNLPYEYRAVHLLKAEQHSAEYLRLNPQGEVPSLVHQGRSIAQSIAILEYLEDVFPNPPLYPKDPYLKARVRQFCENINSYLHPLSNLKVMQYLEKKHGYDQAAKEEWIRHWYKPGFEVLEGMLQTSAGKYSFGDQVTAADACLIPAVFTARRFHVDLSAFPTVVRIDKECQSHPAFEKAHPSRQPDTPPA